ncbi:MAG: sulfotransferase-like domain-containing protein [Planctomycetota bacterium]|jgi:hypothetical protein
MPTRRINLWSGPRNVSTAVMYAFAQRPDTLAIDEPLYAHFLRVSGRPDPAREEVLAAQDPDGEAVVRDVVLGPCERPVLFLKQMAHHLVELDWTFLQRCDNVLLVRDPAAVLVSLEKVLGPPQARDTGLEVQAQVLRYLRGLGQDPPVVDSARLLADPAGVLARLCERLELSPTDAMLAWPACPKPCDGVWAPHWYANVHRSTGFGPPPREETSVPEHLAAVHAACRPHYDALLEHAL